MTNRTVQVLDFNLDDAEGCLQTVFKESAFDKPIPIPGSGAHEMCPRVLIGLGIDDSFDGVFVEGVGDSLELLGKAMVALQRVTAALEQMYDGFPARGAA